MKSFRGMFGRCERAPTEITHANERQPLFENAAPVDQLTKAFHSFSLSYVYACM